MKYLIALLLVSNICFGQGNFNGKANNQLLNAWDINNSTSYGFTLAHTPNNSWHIARKDSVIYWYGTNIDTVNNSYIVNKLQNQSISKRDLSPKYQHNATLYPYCWQYVSYCTGTSAYPYDPTASGNQTLTTITGWNNSSSACAANIFSCGVKCGIVGFQVGWTGPLTAGITKIN